MRAQNTPTLSVDTALTSAFALFGKRWTGLIVAVLTQGPAYFVELRRAAPSPSRHKQLPLQY
jgi:DNA-binding HxlR family transcriptional regulator